MFIVCDKVLSKIDVRLKELYDINCHNHSVAFECPCYGGCEGCAGCAGTSCCADYNV